MYSTCVPVARGGDFLTLNRDQGDLQAAQDAGGFDLAHEFLSEDMAERLGAGLWAQGVLADARLRTQRLILTQGGEPTFVPGDASRPEWNWHALGEQKVVFARRFARRLIRTAYRGAVVVESLGKQYPGESLPRWQIGLYRGRDGTEIWRDPDRLQLNEERPRPLPRNAERRFVRALATSLGLRGAGLPAFEDVAAHLRASGDSRLRALLPRFSRRTRSFKPHRYTASEFALLRPLLACVGWVLPLEHYNGKWRTDAWDQLENEGLDLLPGTGPIGLRLPLSRLPASALRCALSVQQEEGVLVVFLPPCNTFEAFRELVQHAESVARRLRLATVRLEGYPPPGGPDVEGITLTADPGVIEVNLPAARSWPDLDRIIRAVYAGAHESGLRGLKFQPRGRLVPTGGGSHILLGGPSIKQNPFVQRPTMVSSFLRFLQNHPSLSYVFSGLFTGPSCQGPRVDESTAGLVYELEVALRTIETSRRRWKPEQMDALLRNLLMDWNGNTHRAEISVDKFFNLDAANGRMGVIEFRAFEMMPSPEMLLAPNALLRALAASFAETPYTKALVDWQGALHDRFLLPWYLREDLHSVVTFLNARGFSFQPEWFEPHFEFRFPVVTQFTAGDVEWTLRHAIEPWPVMGEHTGTGRVVDASTERLELGAKGLGRARDLIVTVNGVRIPFTRSKRGMSIAGIRYRLFDNPWGLQPQIKSHSPLRFAIIDARRRRVLRQFAYRDWPGMKKGDLSYPTTPEEASRRVRQRLAQSAPSSQPAEWRDAPTSPITPLTLDLRSVGIGSPS